MTTSNIDQRRTDMAGLGVRVATIVRVRRMLADGSFRQLRQELGVSLWECARPYGFDAGQLSAWERGLHTPHPDHAIRLGQLVRDLERIAERTT